MRIFFRPLTRSTTYLVRDFATWPSSVHCRKVSKIVEVKSLIRFWEMGGWKSMERPGKCMVNLLVVVSFLCLFTRVYATLLFGKKNSMKINLWMKFKSFSLFFFFHSHTSAPGWMDWWIDKWMDGWMNQ